MNCFSLVCVSSCGRDSYKCSKEINTNCLSFDAVMLCGRDSYKYSKGDHNQLSFDADIL